MKAFFLWAGLFFISLSSWGQTDSNTTNVDDLFSDSGSTIEEAQVSTIDPTEQFSKTADSIRWGGTVKSSATWSGGWLKWPQPSDLAANWKDSLGYKLSTTLFVDGRPDKDFRFRLSIKTGYPFSNDTSVVTKSGATDTTTSLKVPNLKIWEMFTDVTIEDAVFLRFGKQSASWGAAYFFSPGDVISLTAKDASDPTADREGPVALKASLPIPALKANLTGFVIARDEYFGGDPSQASLRNLGYALQGDILVGDAQLSLGGFYQKDNAPKLVGTLNTGFSFLDLPILNDINLFSEAIVSWGADVLKAEGVAAGNTYASLTNYEKKPYLTGTLGASYSNSDANFSLRAEYYYNPFGSNDADAAQRALNTFGLSQAGLLTPGINTSGRSYGYGDAMTPGVHNWAAYLSFSKINNSKFSFSTFWQHNASDQSGWVKPTLTFVPWDQLTLSAGLNLTYGSDSAQFPLLANVSGSGRASFSFGISFGTGKY